MTGKLPAFLKRGERLRPSVVFVVLSALGALAVLAVMFASHGTLLEQYLCWDSRDTGMDFFHSIEYLRGNQPYAYFRTLYPPLANLLFAFVLHLMPPSLIEKWTWNFLDSLKLRGSEDDLRTYQAPMVAFIVFIILCVLAIALLTYWMARNKSEGIKLGLIVSTVCSYGVLYALERGNIILISWVFTMLFLLTYDHKNRAVSELGLLSLAIAAGLKLYPAFYGLLLLREKRFGQAVRAILYGVLSIVLPALCLGEGLSGLKIWVGTMRLYAVKDGSLMDGLSAQSCLRQLFSDIYHTYGINVSAECISALSAALCILVIVSSFLRREKWRAVFDITMAMVLFSGQPWYVLSFLMIPLLFLIRDEDRFSKSNCVYFFGLALLTIHVPAFLYAGVGWFRTNYYYILFIVLIVCVLADIMRWGVQRGKARRNRAVQE